MANDTVGQIALELVIDKDKFNEELSKLENISENVSKEIRGGFAEAFSAMSEDMKISMKSIEKSVNSVENTISDTAISISGEFSSAVGAMTDSIRDFSSSSGRSTSEVESRGKKTAKNIAKSFLNSAANIKASFDMAIGAVKGMISTCSEMMSAYQTQIEAETKLAATMRNATSASDAQIQSVKDLASSLQELGVVGDEVQLAGAQELATYVSSTESIKTMLPVLDDMIAQQYGFSASTDSAVTIATMLGKVLQGQTTALSRYGYSFDEAQEQLLKYGTEEERVATLAEVVEESVSGVNKSLADTPTGKVKQLSNDFGDLKETLGKLVTDIIYPLVKQLDVIVKKLNDVFTTASNGIKELLGIQDEADTGSGIVSAAENISDSVAEACEDAQDSVDDTVDAIQKAQGQLAGYDNLNVLSQSDEDEDDTETELPVTADEVADVSSAVGDLQDNINSVDCSIFDTLANKAKAVLSVLEPVATAVKNNILTTVGTAQNGIEKYLDKYGDTVSNYSASISSHLKNTVKQTSNGVANIINEATASQERMGEKLSDSYADLLGGASVFTLSYADVFTGMLDIISGNFEEWTVNNKETIGTFFDGFYGNIANFNETIGGILEGIGSTLTEWWDSKGSQAFDGFIDTLFDIGAFLMELWNEYVTPFIDYLTDSIGDLWDNHLSKLWNGILEFVSSLMECISALWNNWFKPLWEKLLKGPIAGIIGALKSVWDIVVDVFGVVIDVIRGIFRSAQGLLDFITGIFTGDIEKAFTGFAEFVHGICIAIWGIIKGAINIVIDALNAVWSMIYGCVKTFIDAIGGVVGKIGDLLGKDWGFSLPDEVPRIPRLANGGLVKAPTIAMVGDNKNAYSDPEVISPLSKLQGMIDSGNEEDTSLLEQVLMYLKMIYESTKEQNGDINITMELDGNIVFKDMIKRDKAYERRHGKGAFAR